MGSEHTHPFWSARFAAATGEAARMIEQHNEKAARRYLQSTLAEFIASPVPAEETRRLLRPYLAGRK
jgi:hypothetical protein